MRMKKSDKRFHQEQLIKLLEQAVNDVCIWSEDEEQELNGRLTDDIVSVKVYVESHNL